MAKQKTGGGNGNKGRSIKPSAFKRSKQAEKRRIRNISIKTGSKTAVKKVLKAAAEGNKSEALVAFAKAAPTLQKAAAKGVIHKKNAARRISRMAKRLNKLS